MRWVLLVLVLVLVTISGCVPAEPAPSWQSPRQAASVSAEHRTLARVEEEPPPVRKDGTLYAESELMGTRFSINLWLEPGKSAREGGQAIRDAIAEVDRIEGLASEWVADSELSHFSAQAGQQPLPLSPDLFTILQRSRVIAEATDGAFDPTFLAIGELWTFKPGSKPPSQAAIDARLALVDWRALELGPGLRGRLKRTGMKVGLGAVAKGYAVDRASALLRERGFANHIVEGGGDTYVSGSKGERTWMVGIQRPEGPGTIGALPLRNRALVTSGGYQRFFEYQGKRYAHILDPRTGWPLDEAESALSVSIVAANATDADAYCTAVAVMGPVGGMAFVESEPGIEAVIIDRSGAVQISTGLREIYVSAPPGR
ncbi:MAG TPA: FAD:protein FMN transferase [Nannocystis exedens]|nr:FAD:protein FMN transferase [Nannocystis exedens]